MKISHIVFTATFFLLSWSFGICTNYYVNDGFTTGDIFCTVIGNNSNSGTAPSAPKLTLKNLWNTYGPSGTNVLTSGDVIYIDAGTYSADGGGNAVDEHQFSITVNGLTFIGAGFNLTIFDHNNGGTATDFFMYINANNITIQDMSFREFDNNGSQTPGHSGQVLTLKGTNINIINCSLTQNGQSGGNPSISVLANSSVTIQGGGSTCNVWQTMYTGGVEAYGKNITLTIKDYVFAYNHKDNGYDGGGLLIDGDATTIVTVSNCRFSNNQAIKGGGIKMYDGDLRISDCVFENNIASDGTTGTIYGGGIHINAGTCNISRCKFNSNTTVSNTLRGGGISCRYISLSSSTFSSRKTISLTVDSCVFSGNTGGTSGFDIYGANGSSNACNITIRDCAFQTSGNYQIVSDASSPVSSINISYSGSPTRNGSNITLINSLSNRYTANPSSPTYTGNCATGITLPVIMSFFRGLCNSGHIILNWQTTSEINNEYFVVERSVNGYDYYPLAIVHGNGTTNSIIDYNFTDYSPNSTRNFYRLKQVDFDGKTTFTDPIFISFPCVSSIIDLEDIEIIIDNYSIQADIFSDEKSSITVEISDITGKQLLIYIVTLTEGNNSYSYNIQNLAKGIYFISFINNDDVSSKKFNIY